MLKRDDNERLTCVGPGTPGGAWMRRFWHPIALSDRWQGERRLWDYDEPVTFRGRAGTVGSWGKALGEFTGSPTEVRILGEDLVLFRDGSGRLGLIAHRCPHRGASFVYGRLHPEGIECAYHGWLFDARGQCLAMPAEPADSTFPAKNHTTAYPVQEMGGLIWTYMGPGEAPALPRLDVVAREDGIRVPSNLGLWPANWLQICENSVDQAHTGILHAGSGGERRDLYGTEVPKPHWEANQFGVRSTQVRRGANHTRVSQYVMPTINRLAEPWPGGRVPFPRQSAHYRTPVDDHHTLFFTIVFIADMDGQQPTIPPDVPLDTTASLHNHRIQDYAAIVSQGAVFDRSQEHLARSDGGVIMLRRLVAEGIDAVAAGQSPLGTDLPAGPGGIIDLSEIVIDSSMAPLPPCSKGAAA